MGLAERPLELTSSQDSVASAPARSMSIMDRMFAFATFDARVVGLNVRIARVRWISAQVAHHDA